MTVSDADIHAAVTEVWQAVLDRPSLEADSSFFRLGGTSIAAMRACARLSQRLGRHVPVRMMFEHDGRERFASALVAAVDTLPELPRD